MNIQKVSLENLLLSFAFNFIDVWNAYKGSLHPGLLLVLNKDMCALGTLEAYKGELAFRLQMKVNEYTYLMGYFNISIVGDKKGYVNCTGCHRFYVTGFAY